MTARATRLFLLFAASSVVACGGSPPAASPPSATQSAAPDAKPAPTAAKPATPATPSKPVASESAPPADKPAVVEPATPPTDKRLVGHWTYSAGAEPRFAFNAKGRAQMSLGGTKCVGNYAIKDDKLTVKYDAGQRGCSDFGPPASFSLKDKDATLSFAGASYKRDDAKDDTSF